MKTIKLEDLTCLVIFMMHGKTSSVFNAFMKIRHVCMNKEVGARAHHLQPSTYSPAGRSLGITTRSAIIPAVQSPEHAPWPEPSLPTATPRLRICRRWFGVSKWPCRATAAVSPTARRINNRRGTVLRLTWTKAGGRCPAGRVPGTVGSRGRRCHPGRGRRTGRAGRCCRR